MSRRLGRPPRISRDDIVRAVVEVGFASASLPVVAAHLGVSHSTLYGHFASRDAMAAAAAESVLASCAWPSRGPGWRAYVVDVAGVVFHACRDHPGLAHELVTLPEAPPSLTAALSDIGRALLDAGMPADDAVVASNAIFHVSAELFADRAGDGDRRRGQIDAALPGIDPDLHGPLLEALDRPVDDWFQRTLDLVLDGVESTLRRGHGSPNTPS